MPPEPPRRPWLVALLLSAAAAIVASCKSGTDTAPTALPKTPDPAAPPVATGPVPGDQGSARASSATTPRAYRQDGATHLYGLNAQRIYKGRMPPLLYAIGTLQINIDAAGKVGKLEWMRAPRHAPEVIAEIERTVRAAAPFPAPIRLGKVVYTDTWLWDKSGRFQLDTLTEGQN